MLRSLPVIYWKSSYYNNDDNNDNNNNNTNDNSFFEFGKDGFQTRTSNFFVRE
jgi:hypothetical protein